MLAKVSHYTICPACMNSLSSPLLSAATPERVQTLTIKEGERGYSYAVVFEKCLDGNVTWVEVEDPYIRARHQLHNFVRFCELVVRRCRKITRIHLTTTSSSQGESSGDVSN